MTLILEVREGEGWKKIGDLPAGAPPGSLSNNTDDGERDIIQFQCLADGAIVERCIGGLDEEIGFLRSTVTVGMERLATLAEHGECFELELRTDRMLKAVPLRFRYERDR